MTKRIFDASLSSLDDALSFSRSTLSSLGCPSDTAGKLILCLEELFVNVSSYAYGGNVGKVELSFRVDGGALRATVTDSGIPFDPTAKPDPDITLSAEERTAGGLGIFMVKKLTDSLKYERRGEKNVVTVIKKL